MLGCGGATTMRYRIICVAIAALIVAACFRSQRVDLSDDGKSDADAGTVASSDSVVQGWRVSVSSPPTTSFDAGVGLDLVIHPPEGERLRGDVGLRVRSDTIQYQPV